jgi:hypothetical protein
LLVGLRSFPKLTEIIQWVPTATFSTLYYPFLPNLTKMTLFGRNQPDIVKMVQRCPNLEKLTIINNTIRVKVCPNLEPLGLLTTLVLHGFEMCNSSYSELAKLSSVTDLTLHTRYSPIESPQLLGKALSQTNVQILHIIDDLPDLEVPKRILEEVQLVRMHFRCDNLIFNDRFSEFIRNCMLPDGQTNPKSLWIDYSHGYYIDGTITKKSTTNSW